MAKDKLIDGLKVVLLSVLLSEAIDDMKGTTLYKREIKQMANRLQKMLEPNVQQLDAVYDADPTTATNVMNEVDALVQKLAKCNITDLTMLNQMHEHYMKNTEEWQKQFGFEFKQLNT